MPGKADFDTAVLPTLSISIPAGHIATARELGNAAEINNGNYVHTECTAHAFAID